MATTDFAEMTKTTQEQFLGALSAVQDTIVENYAKVTGTAAKFTPARVQSATKDLPVVPQTVLGLGYDFTTKLLEAQRTFADKLFAAAVPASTPATGTATATATAPAPAPKVSK